MPFVISRCFFPVVLAAIVLTAEPVPAAAADGLVARGSAVFNRCRACHTIDEPRHKVGPTLAGLLGQPAGAATDAEGRLFPNYSPALRAAGERGLVWTEASLDAFLTAPDRLVPGTRMPFSGLRTDADRRAVVAYLKSRM